MKFLIVLAMLGLSQSAFSQTKWIAHRSHSGSDANFHWAESPDNFGLHPDLERKRNKIRDSLQKHSADSLRKRIITDSLEKIRRKKEERNDRDGNGFWTFNKQ